MALTIGLLASVSSAASAEDLNKLNRNLADIESDTQRLLSRPVRVDTLKSDTFVEERLTDGELNIRLEDYLRAAILFTDIVAHYQTHRAYPEALFLLGESLFLAGDNLGAKRRYEETINRGSDPAFAPYLERSLSRLIEIAIDTQDFRGVDVYFAQLEALPSAALSMTTAYFRAKYLYNRAVPVNQVLNAPADRAIRGLDQTRLEQARQGFFAIPSGTAYSLRAKYFVGTIHILRAEYIDAIAAFRTVLGHEPANEAEAEVVELTYLALGRLYYETGQPEQAVDAYRAVPQTSDQFDVALYELAWTYIAMGDAVQAERALEVLSVAAPDSPLNADGKVLRGELLARAARYNEAEAVFDEVREQFGPISDELARKQLEHPDLPAYFRALVRGNLEDFDIDDFLPETARQWVRVEGNYERALGVLADLSEAKQLVDETDELAARITAALSAPNGLAVFSDLRRQRERTTALRNRLAQLRGAYIDDEERALGGGRRSGQADRIRVRRKELQAEVMKMPVDTEDFVERDFEELDEYRALGRELQGLRVEILGLEARIVASRTGMAAVDPEKVDRATLEAELASHQTEVADYEEQLVWIRRRLEVGRLHVGVGDKRYEADDLERSKFNDLVNREREITGSGGAAFDVAQGRIAAVERLLDQRDVEVDAVVEKRVSQMMAVVDEETRNLARYRTTLRSLEGETEDVVGTITYLNFERIRRRFHDLVLRADVGKIDVAWAKREDYRLRIDALTRDRAREIQALDDEFRDVMDQADSSEEGQ
ncbi:MAG: tetratricopeptide repeat protein [Deltaproteobacteria bacterium]|nr:tetratricopeptide repeat protein [Deltaproteobacteria bacterium]